MNRGFRNKSDFNNITEAALPVLNVVSFLEFINTAARIYKLLFACKEGMTLVANIHFQRFHVFSGTRFKGSAACANDRHFVIIGMYFGLHIFTSL